MIICVDISNTNIVMGGMEKGSSSFVCRLSSSKERTSDEFSVLLRLLAEQNDFRLSECEGVIMSSVVPQLTPVIKNALQVASGKNPMVLGPGIKTGLNIKINDPGGLGGDFVAASVAALDYGLPCIMIHMGTATALAVLDAEGCYIGGAICPGIMVSVNALASGTSQLPHVNLELPAKIIGRDTIESMKSGLIYGSAAMLDGLIARFEDELGARCVVVATGDWASAVTPLCKRKGIIIDEDLLLRGLEKIYIKNSKSRTSNTDFR